MSWLMPQWEKNQWFCCKQQWQEMLHQKQLIVNLKPMEFWLRITSIFVQGIQFVWNWQNLTKFDTKWRLKKKCSIIWNIYITLSVILACSMNFSDWNIQIMAISFIFVVRNKELFIGIKYPTFGCNVCLFLSYTQI